MNTAPSINVETQPPAESKLRAEFLDSLCKNMIQNENLNITVEFESEEVIELHKTQDQIKYTFGNSTDITLPKRFGNLNDSRVFSINISDFNQRQNISTTADKIDSVKFYTNENSFESLFQKAEIYHTKSEIETDSFDFYGLTETENYSIIFMGQAPKKCDIQNKIKISLHNGLMNHSSDIEAILHNTMSDINDCGCNLADAQICLVLFNKKNNELKMFGPGATLIISNKFETNIYLSGKTYKQEGNEIFSIFLSKNDKVVLFSNGINRQLVGLQKRKLGRRGVLGVLEIINDTQEVSLDSFNKTFQMLKGENRQELDQTMLVLTV